MLAILSVGKFFSFSSKAFIVAQKNTKCFYAIWKCYNSVYFDCKATVLLYFLFACLTASVMFKFADQQTVRRVVRALPPVGVGTYYGIPQTRYACFG